MRITLRLLLLPLLWAIPCFAGDDLNALVDQLFSKDAGQRTAARAALLTHKDADLKKILAFIEARQPAKGLLQIYDVSDLKADILNWPDMSLLIKDAADGAETFRYDAKRGVVIVMGSRCVHQKIAEQLNELRRARGKLVQVQAWFAETRKPTADLPANLLANLPADMTTDDVQEFVKSVDGKLVSSPRLVCRNGQSATIELVEKVSFIEEFDVEIACGVCILDPVIGIAQSGVTVEVRPVITKKGTVQLATTARQTKIDLPFPTLTLPTITGQVAEIQIPTLRTVAVARLLTCKPNRIATIKLDDGMFVLISAMPLERPDNESPGDASGDRQKK